MKLSSSKLEGLIISQVISKPQIGGSMQDILVNQICMNPYCMHAL